jgi:hypothetical protein
MDSHKVNYKVDNLGLRISCLQSSQIFLHYMFVVGESWRGTELALLLVAFSLLYLATTKLTSRPDGEQNQPPSLRGGKHGRPKPATESARVARSRALVQV